MLCSNATVHPAHSWKSGYEAQAKPAIAIWNAFDWVDRWNSSFLGWWENGEYVTVKVEGVRTVNLVGKLRRRGRFSGYRSDWKKAYVKLKAGEKVPDFAEI